MPEFVRDAPTKLVMPGQKREARLRARRPGHPRLNELAAMNTWMAGTSPAMTTKKTSFLLRVFVHETHILPCLAIRPQGAHCRDRTRPDRQNRVRPDHRRAGHAQ